MILCYVTDRHLLSEAAPLDALLRHIGNAAATGVDWIQIREKDLSGRELADFTRRALAAVYHEATQGNPKPPQIIVNDRIDVALAAGAAGVHLSSTSIAAEKAFQWFRTGNAPENFAIGVSCHSLAEAVAAEKAGASYIFFGPIYETPSKTAFGKPQDIEKLAEVCRSVRIPVVAIGGITETNAPACVKAGASGIAAIRMFQQAADTAALAGIVSRLKQLN
jgi:thiamine-phosphate pyrophosphorylase